MDGEVKMDKQHIGTNRIRQKFLDGGGCNDCRFRLLGVTAKNHCPKFHLKVHDKRRARCLCFVKAGEDTSNTKFYLKRNQNSPYQIINRMYSGKKPTVKGIKRIKDVRNRFSFMYHRLGPDKLIPVTVVEQFL